MVRVMRSLGGVGLVVVARPSVAVLRQVVANVNDLAALAEGRCVWAWPWFLPLFSLVLPLQTPRLSRIAPAINRYVGSHPR